MTLAVEGVGCAGCIRKIESGLTQIARDHRCAAQLHPAPPCRRLARRRDRCGAHHRSARGHWLSRASVRARTRRRRRERTGQMAAEMSGCRRLRRDERDAAVGLGVGRQRLRYDPGDARPLPLAFRADRAAGGRLCGPAVLSERVPGAPHAASSTWTCRSRSA